MKKKTSLAKKLFWRIVFVLVVMVIIYERYPDISKSTINSLMSVLPYQNSWETSIQWTKLSAAVETCTISAKNDKTSFSTNVFMVRFDPAKIQTRVLYKKNLTTAKIIAENTGALATINASFFDPQGRPLGVLIQNGKVIQHAPVKGMSNSGIFCIKYDRPIIYRRRYFKENGATESIQSMPPLIHNGRAIQDIKNKNIRKRRSGIALDFTGNILIYATDTHLGGLSLADVQQMLLQPELNIRSALNLDGGRSSQLYFNYNNTVKNIIGLVDVPVFLGFFEK